MPRDPILVTTNAELDGAIRSARAAPTVAVDVEGNGLFAYRARLCTVQLAWNDGDEPVIVLVDALTVDPAGLGELLAVEGPAKVLHDFTFDVKLLSEAGVTLANVRDTSVAARMLGRKATGLASLLASELGIVVGKELQQHDWSRRPLRQAELDYLAGDVRYLLALEDKLAAEARERDIAEEIAVECVFKYDAALKPPRDKRPAYLRVKGIDLRNAQGLAVLRRLVDERDRIAQQWDVPPFKVVGNEVLLFLARAQPLTQEDLRRTSKGMSPRLLAIADRIVGAIHAGIADGHVPAVDIETPPRPSKVILAARHAREKRLSAWRKQEATERGVDEQVVLPGHCLQELVALETEEAQAVAEVKGLGAKRLARYGATLATLLVDVPPPTDDAPPKPEP